MKSCRVCGETKPLADFAAHSTTDGRRHQCRKCVSVYSREWREANRDSARARHHRYHYNLTPERAAELLVAQGYRCPGCESAVDLGADVDHDHACCPIRGGSCGRCVRGFLCGPCNRALGQANDDPARLRRLADYLDRQGRSDG